jgi:hypothetical protein
MKLLSPVNDFVFKRIFGDRRNTAVLARSFAVSDLRIISLLRISTAKLPR